MKKKVLILGSEGQVGAHLKDYLKNKNYSVLEFDIAKSKFQDLRKIRNKKLANLIRQSSFIYFLAFDVGGSRYLNKYQNTFGFVSNNILLMQNTFELIRKYKKKFIFASSQMSNMNHSNYGVLKSVGEKYTKILGGITVKFWNVYGIEKDLTKSHVITDFIIKALTKKKISMLTNGNEEREFLYAEDCCRGLEIIMKKFDSIIKQKNYIDLTTFKSTKIINIAKIIKTLLKKMNLEISIVPSKNKDIVQMNKKNKADKYFLKFWKPKNSIQEGIEEVLKYYTAQYKKNI
ncbi:NAD-dependent epimerase/dehydratase family protein [Pelagibacteraceae bacterium]|jgi:nucleoside-diphosphate-sugar epimerase|nr:NAD-dependent epimerase/dehydratase family protein [Pelagibacteraceae bacterium]